MTESYSPPIIKIIFSIEKIADALWIENDEAKKEFTDGRVISRFSEYWAGKLYGFKKCENTNEQGYDGFISSPLYGKHKVAVRSLTNAGIRFQQSKYIGSGRKCRQEDLLSSLEDLDFEIVVDIVDFPEIVFLPIFKNSLITLIEEKKLTKNGWKREAFYKNLYDVFPKDITIDETKTI